MAEDIIGVPNDEQALAAVGGGDREYSDAEKERYAQQIQDAARANAQWRDSLPFSQQLALANVPTVSAPPVDDTTADTEPETAESEKVPANAGV